MLKYRPTKEMEADLLTKPVSRSILLKLKNFLCIEVIAREPKVTTFFCCWKNRNLRVTVQEQARHTGAGLQHISSIDTSSDSPRCAVMQAPGFNMGCPPGHGG